MDKKTILPTLSLFASLSTLLCCALPALLVTLGAGAVLASIIHISPWLVFLSKYKVYTFLFSAFILIFAGIFLFRSRNDPCPIDPDEAKACNRLRKTSILIYIFSLFLFAIAFFFAFLAVEIFF